MRIKSVIICALLALSFLPTQTLSAPTAPYIPPALTPNEAQGDYNHPQRPPRKINVDTVLFNCYQYVRAKYPTLPRTAEIHNNLQQIPAEVVVFDYSGLPHYAVVRSVSSTTLDIAETNFKRGKKTYRTIPRTDPAIIGYYDIKS